MEETRNATALVGRTFRLWDYNVSHNQLLLRSPMHSNVVTNVDVVFWGVRYLEMPTSFAALTIEGGREEERSRICGLIKDELSIEEVHALVCDGRRFVIVSPGYKVLVNDLDIFQSSLEYFREPMAHAKREELHAKIVSQMQREIDELRRRLADVPQDLASRA